MEKVTCPTCGEFVEIDQDGTCMECVEPLAYPAISKAQEKEKLGKIVSEGKEWIPPNPTPTIPKKTTK